MKYRIEAPGNPVAYGEYQDEMECRSAVRRSGLAPHMELVKVTPVWPGQPEPPLCYSINRTQVTVAVTVSVPFSVSAQDALEAVTQAMVRASSDRVLLEGAELA